MWNHARMKKVANSISSETVLQELKGNKNILKWKGTKIIFFSRPNLKGGSLNRRKEKRRNTGGKEKRGNIAATERGKKEKMRSGDT